MLRHWQRSVEVDRSGALAFVYMQHSSPAIWFTYLSSTAIIRKTYKKTGPSLFLSTLWGHTWTRESSLTARWLVGWSRVSASYAQGGTGRTSVISSWVKKFLLGDALRAFLLPKNDRIRHLFIYFLKMPVKASCWGLGFWVWVKSVESLCCLDLEAYGYPNRDKGRNLTRPIYRK